MCVSHSAHRVVHPSPTLWAYANRQTSPRNTHPVDGHPGRHPAKTLYFFGQPRGYKANEVNHGFEAKYIASGMLQRSRIIASRSQLLWKLASKLPKEVQERINTSHLPLPRPKWPPTVHILLEIHTCCLCNPYLLVDRTSSTTPLLLTLPLEVNRIYTMLSLDW